MDIEQLKKWHEDDDHRKIIDAIEQVPLEERDFEIVGLYARALNNADRYQEALEQLMSVREQGEEDGVWNFRVGYSLYFLRRKKEASEYFQRAIDFGDDCDDTRTMLAYSIAEKPWDDLIEYIDKYREISAMLLGGKVMTDYFNNSQLTLMAYYFFYEQVSNGGFIQLVQNGYGDFIFNTPFSETIKTWGAEEACEIIEKARIIYEKYEDELKKETTEEEFLELYSEITDFEPLEEDFFEIMKDETETIRRYVEENADDFRVDVASIYERVQQEAENDGTESGKSHFLN
jgi:tetratricopeptide (TPR) repeat protein